MNNFLLQTTKVKNQHYIRATMQPTGKTNRNQGIAEAFYAAKRGSIELGNRPAITLSSTQENLLGYTTQRQRAVGSSIKIP